MTVNNVIPINSAIGIEFIVDDCGNSGISHPDWDVVMMKIDGNICMIAKDTGEIRESMESNLFNSILYYWLVIDCPEVLSQH